MQAEFKYRDSSGNIKTGYIGLDDYRHAADHNMRVAGLINRRYSDADPAYGSAFEQGAKYLGIFARADRKYGVLPTTIRAIMDGSCTQQMAGFQLSGGTIVSPKGPVGGSTPASRLFFPELVLGFIEEELKADYGVEEAAFNRMFAMDTSITNEVWTQPVINTSAPGAQDMRPQAQNAMPANMVSITASQTSKALGAISIGLQMSDQAMRDSTLDLVAIIVKEQTMEQRMRHLWRDLNRILTGNPDAGETALTPEGFKAVYDGTAAANTITHSGYLDMLWDPSRVYSWDYMIGTLASYKAIESRSGRPLMYDPATSGNVGNEGSYGLNPGNPRLINFTTANPNYLAVPEGVVPAKQILMFDSRYALGRVTNVAANYSSTESMVMQRSQVWRWDMAEFVYRFRDEAIKVVDFTNP